MGPSPQKHRNRPSRTEARSAERHDSGQAQGTFPQTQGGQAAPRQDVGQPLEKGPGHTAPPAPHSTRTAKEPPGLAGCPHGCSCMEMLFTLPITQCLLINTGSQPAREEGTKAGERRGKGHCSSCCRYPCSSWDGTVWVQRWERPREVGLPLQSQGETKGDVPRGCVRNPSTRRDWREESQGELLVSS